MVVSAASMIDLGSSNEKDERKRGLKNAIPHTRTKINEDIARPKSSLLTARIVELR